MVMCDGKKGLVKKKRNEQCGGGRGNGGKDMGWEL